MEIMKELTQEELLTTNGGKFPWGPISLLLYVADEIWEGIKEPCE